MCERNEREGQALFVNKKHQKKFLVFLQTGLPGFEPGNDGVRVRCLTVWR